MNSLTTKGFKDMLTVVDESHNEMLKVISDELPVITSMSNNFGKSQSQFMDNMLTTSHPTPIRNVRQIMAEINKSLEALKENYYKNKRKEVEIKILQRKLGLEQDDLEQELISIQIEEKLTQIETSKKYFNGAIRKISNYTEQYKSILKTIGVKSIDEVDFEKEEEQYHIKKAFEQGLNAARSNGGRIDEGNQIYFTQIGINGTVAQKCVTGYLMLEEQKIKDRVDVTAENQWTFLEEMYQKFKGSAKTYVEKKGMNLTSKNSLLGGTR